MSTDPEGGTEPAEGPVGPEKVPPPALRGHLVARQSMPKLDTPEAISAELERELWKLEVVGRRLTEVRQLVHGYYTASGYVAGVDFEYAEVYDRLIRKLYGECHDTQVPKENRKKWPGEDVRTSIVNADIEKEFRERKQALKGELLSLEEYRRITESRANGLQSLLGYRRDTLRLEGLSR